MDEVVAPTEQEVLDHRFLPVPRGEIAVVARCRRASATRSGPARHRHPGGGGRWDARSLARGTRGASTAANDRRRRRRESWRSASHRGGGGAPPRTERGPTIRDGVDAPLDPRPRPSLERGRRSPEFRPCGWLRTGRRVPAGRAAGGRSGRGSTSRRDAGRRPDQPTRTGSTSSPRSVRDGRRSGPSPSCRHPFGSRCRRRRAAPTRSRPQRDRACWRQDGPGRGARSSTPRRCPDRGSRGASNNTYDARS